ncbi:29189_t:CDS:2, partial [Gigaspora margarita]
SSTEKWKKITDNVLIKAEANGTLASYYRDHKDEYICMGCYNAIVVNAASSFKEHALNWDIGLKRRRNSFSISESISLLTNFIFEREVLDGEPPVFSFSQLRSIAVNKNNDLSFFFDQIEDMACLGKKTEAEKRELERSLAYQCYLMCWNQSRVIPLWNLHESETGGDYFSWVDGVNVLSKFLYDHEKVEQKPAIYSFKQLRKEMVAKDIRLSSFFNSIYNAALPSKKSDKYLDKLDKRLAVECYIICSNQNSKLTAFKEDISLFLDLMGLSAEALDALSHAESYLENNKYSALALNVDDYHNIHAKRMPNTCSTSTVAHMTTLLLNHINITAIPQMTLNNASIHNPKLIDFELICNTLGHFYMERMAKTFNDRFYYETSLDEKLENLSLHNYDARITERREERKMKDTILLDFFELKLEDVASYISALQQQLSKTAKVINAKKANNAFENAFVTQHKSTYANKDHLILLTKKAEVFLLRVFED